MQNMLSVAPELTDWARMMPAKLSFRGSNPAGTSVG